MFRLQGIGLDAQGRRTIQKLELEPLGRNIYLLRVGSEEIFLDTDELIDLVGGISEAIRKGASRTLAACTPSQLRGRRSSSLMVPGPSQGGDDMIFVPDSS